MLQISNDTLLLNINTNIFLVISIMYFKLERANFYNTGNSTFLKSKENCFENWDFSASQKTENKFELYKNKSGSRIIWDINARSVQGISSRSKFAQFYNVNKK